MENIFNIFKLIISIYLLWKGAEVLVESASKIARHFGISDLVIGLTVVSLGTSAPEFAVSINAALKELPSISIGNIVGSNIFNLGFILGTVAIIKPVHTNKTVVFRDGLFLFLITFLLILFTVNSAPYVISRIEGSIFILILVSYLVYLFYKKEAAPFADDVPETEEKSVKLNPKNYALAAVGMIMIYFGGEFLVSSASALAKLLGISDWVIAVTIVAAGTSAPEFVTSIVAVIKGKSGISIGNLIGSDLFNILGVLGVASLIRPLAVDPAALLSLAMLIFMVGLVIVFMRTGWKVSRKEGIILFCIGIARWILDFSKSGF